MSKKYFKNYSKIILLLIALSCLWLSFRKVQVPELIKTLREANFWIYLLVLLPTLFVHFIRAKRWQLLLAASEKKVGFWNAYHSMMSGYFVNLLTGKLGEVVRCVALKRTDEVSIAGSAATVLVERVVDVLCLLALLVFVVWMKHQALLPFVKAEMIQPLMLHKLWVLWVLIIIFLGLLIAAYLLRKYSLRITESLQKFKQAIVSVFYMKKKGAFLLYTALIWLLYHFMTWFWFFAWPHESGLNAFTALAVISIGGIGRSLPVPGHGLGTYHFFASEALKLCGVNQEMSLAIPIAIHSGQLLFYLVFGSLSAIWLSLKWKK